MNSVDTIRRLHRHRAWVTDNLLNAASQLRDDQLRALFQIGQGSIWNSLTHLYAAEYVWLEALLGKEDGVLPGDLPGKLPGNQQGEGALTGLDQLRQNWKALEKRWDDYLSALQSDSLDDIIYRKSSSAGRFGSRRSDVLLHVCTHAHYTSAQVVNMFRQVGVEKLPDTMLIALARREMI